MVPRPSYSTCPSFLSSATISRARAESTDCFDKLKKCVGSSRYRWASLNRSPSRTRSRFICRHLLRVSYAMPPDESKKWLLRASLDGPRNGGCSILEEEPWSLRIHAIEPIDT